jgi:hypothetical protein
MDAWDDGTDDPDASSGLGMHDSGRQYGSCKDRESNGNGNDMGISNSFFSCIPRRRTTNDRLATGLSNKVFGWHTTQEMTWAPVYTRTFLTKEHG